MTEIVYRFITPITGYNACMAFDSEGIALGSLIRKYRVFLTLLLRCPRMVDKGK